MQDEAAAVTPVPTAPTAPGPARQSAAIPPLGWVLGVLVVVVHLGAALAPIVGWHHPDEMQQYVEQPFRVLHGYGFHVWEFEQGTRNWLLPGIVLVLQATCEALGVRDPLQILQAVRVAQHTLFLVGVVRLFEAARLLRGTPTAWICAALVGLSPALLGLTNHTLSEAWALPFVMIAAWPLARHLGGAGDRSLLSAGALLGVATLLRLQVGLLLPVLVIALAAPGPRRTMSLRGALHFTGGAGCVLVAGWLLDGLTHGRFAQSTIENLRVHADLQTHATMGIQPWTFYVTESFDMLGLLPALLAVGCLLQLRRHPRDPFAWCAIVFCTVHAFVPHKEGRFLLPVLPLAMVASAFGFATVVARLSAPAARWLLRAIALTILVSTAVSLRYFWRDDESVGRALAARYLSEQPIEDWCVVEYEQHDIGGYFLLRRDVPFRRHETLAAAVADHSGHPERCRFVALPARLVDSDPRGQAPTRYVVAARFRNTAVLRVAP